METDYLEYRGKCKEMAEAAAAQDPTLKVVRGYYHCPLWGKQAHWWCVRADGTIYDPTVKQFPSKGVGAEYVEYDGTIDCEYCGTTVSEMDKYQIDHHVYCSGECYGHDVGF